MWSRTCLCIARYRHRGLAKNPAQLLTLFGLANLVSTRQRLKYPPSAQKRIFISIPP